MGGAHSPLRPPPSSPFPLPLSRAALAAAKALRAGEPADLLGRLAGDRRIGLGKKALHAIMSDSARFVGAAPNQVDGFLAEVKPLARRFKGAADYLPGRLL